MGIFLTNRKLHSIHSESVPRTTSKVHTATPNYGHNGDTTNKLKVRKSRFCVGGGGNFISNTGNPVAEPHSSVGSTQDLRTGGRWFDPRVEDR